MATDHFTRARVNVSHIKEAQTDYPIHELGVKRWSPYSYDPTRSVTDVDLKSIFESARWAASSFNEQPWRYIIARREDDAGFATMLSCLTEGNQSWAGKAPVVGLGLIKATFTRNDKPNRVAMHDLGLASGALTFEATARGLYVHQMGGIYPDKAREVYGIPDGYEAVTGLAIGYLGTPEALPEALRPRDTSPRTRRPLGETVFSASWNEAAF
jgi:nitroreductase